MMVHVDAIAGDDANDGATAMGAVATLATALARMRAGLAGADDHVRIRLKGGQDHNLDGLLSITAADNRNAGQRLIFESYGAGTPFITGKRRVTGWVDAGGGLARAPLTGVIRDVWMDDHRPARALHGFGDASSTVVAWDEPGQAVRIADATVAPAAGWSNVDFIVQMGWAISHLPVQAVEPAVGMAGHHWVTFDPLAASVEFAKGVPGQPGLGASFAFGPYHNASGQRCWWSHAQAFMTAGGDWWHDEPAGQLYMRLPAGIADAGALDAAGVFVAGSVQDALYINGGWNPGDEKVAEIDLSGIGFRRFGWVPPEPAEGYVGYLPGVGLRNDGGAMGFRFLPAALTVNNARSIRILGCRFQDMSHVAIRAFWGLDGLHVSRSGFGRLASAAINLGGITSGTYEGAPFTFETMPASTRNGDIFVTHNVFAHGGQVYLGAACFTGAARRARVMHNLVTDWTDNGLELGNGARWFGMWTRDNVLAHNDLRRVMTVKVDGGALYKSGNVAGFVARTNHRLADPVAPARIYANRVRQVQPSGFDPAGGYAVACYLDLGSQADQIYGNDIDDVEKAFKLNCVSFATIRDNRVGPSIDELLNVTYFGFEIVLADGSSFKIEPPLSNPPTQTDYDNFWGLNENEAFAFFVPFTSPEAAVNPDGTWNTLSIVENNTAATQVGGPYGPDADVLALYADLIGQAA